MTISIIITITIIIIIIIIIITIIIYRWEKVGDEKHIVLLLTCGTVFIELWRECLLKMLVKSRLNLQIFDDLQKRYAKWHTVKL